MSSVEISLDRPRQFWRVGRWFAAIQGMPMAERTFEEQEAFTWRQGREIVRLKREGDSWHVCYLSGGKLLGPQRCIYEARHRIAKHAAWDMMARVIKASHDEDEGVQAASMAAKWMRRISTH